MDAIVSEGRGGEFEVTEVAGEDLCGHGHDIVEEVDDDRGSSKVKEELELEPCCWTNTLGVRDAGICE